MTTPAEWLDNSCNRCTQDGQTAAYLAPITPGVLPSDHSVSNSIFAESPFSVRTENAEPGCDPAACMPGVATPDQCPECRAAPDERHHADCPLPVCAAPPVSQTGNAAPEGNTATLNSDESYSGLPNPLLASMAATFDRCLALATAKNADYTGGGDPFVNFRHSQMVGVHPVLGILVRMIDKINRVASLIDSDPQVGGEAILDSLDDLTNYPAIARAWLESER